MKIAILTHTPNAYTERRFMEVAEKKEHCLQFIHLSSCYMNLSARSPAVHYRHDEMFEGFDAIIPRINPIHTFYGTAVLRQFEMMGIYTLNSASSITRSRDKLRALQLLTRKKIPLPITGFADSPEESEKLIEMVGGAPLIIRLLEGTQGRGIIFAETHQAAVSVINAFKQLKTKILVQEFIKEAKGMDIRCVVVGHKVIAAVERHTIEGGSHSTGYAEMSNAPVHLTAAEKKMAIQAAKAMKLNLATVDIIRSNRGPLVLDIDCSPSIESIEKILDYDILSEILDFVADDFQKNLKT